MDTAMIFAAGLGTRLRPLTLSTPKPLVEVAGRPMLLHLADGLKRAGIKRLVLNTHWLGEQVEQFALQTLSNDFEILISAEPTILGTGGGLMQARQWLTKDFLLINADVLTNLDFKQFIRQHEAHGAWVSLAVNQNPAASNLVLDEEGMMVGIERKGKQTIVTEPVGEVSTWNFCGIHGVGEGFLQSLQEPVEFSIIDEYLKRLPQGLEVQAIDIDGSFWLDIGTPADLERANQTWAGY